MSSSDSLPVPRKNTAYRVYFPILKNDGSIITGWTSPAATLSKDGATSASSTNTPTEIATSWGIGYLDLTSTEMNADAVILKATVTNTGALAQVIVLYPQEAGDIRVNPTYWNDSAVATPDTAGYPKITVKAGTGTGEINLSSGVADANVAKWNGAAVATPATAGYPAVTVKPGAGTGEIDLSSGQVKVGTNNDKTSYQLADGAITAAKIASDAITSAKIATDAIGSAQLAASGVSEIQSGLATAASISSLQSHGDANWGGGTAPTVSEIVDAIDADSTQLARIAAKTDLIAANNVTTIAPIDPLSGDLTLVRGDDYTVSSGRALPSWSSDDWTIFDLTHAEAVTFRARTRYSETVFEKTAAVLSGTSVRVELTSAETGAFAVGHDAYQFDVQAVLATGDVVTLAQGHLSIREDVR